MNVNPESWLSQIDDQQDIRSLIIPGTHNSCTFNTDLSVSQCQSYDIYDQFYSGVRYFDIRVKITDGVPRIFHGLDDLGMTLYDLADAFEALLGDFPSELVLIRMQREETASGIPDGDYYIEMINVRQELIGWNNRKIYSSAMLAAAPDWDKWTLGANRGAVIIVEFNAMSGIADVDATNALITGVGGYGFLTSEIAQKWDFVCNDNLGAFDPEKFNRLNLYSSGGIQLAGIPVPNPKGFTQAFAAQYYDRDYLVGLLADQIAPNAPVLGGCIVKMDFEEEYDGRESFYRTIINMNFHGLRAKVLYWGQEGDPENRLVVNYTGAPGSTEMNIESDILPVLITNRLKTVAVSAGTNTASLSVIQRDR
jgi:hypothetical protein